MPTMRIVHFLLLGCVSAFVSPLVTKHHTVSVLESKKGADDESHQGLIVKLTTNPHVAVESKDADDESRKEFLAILATASLSLASIGLPMSASARGRATLDQSYERYAPRIIAGGQYYAGDFRKMIGSSDWQGLKLATSDPPKKTKADRVKADGGVSERAAQAGKFSDARVVVAADLFASCFSDSAVTTKTKKMQAEVAVLREVVAGINSAAREALGEDTGGGGLFGFGSKKPSQAELAKQVKSLYGKGGNAYNQYAFLANDGLPLSLNKFPYLQ